MLIFSKKILPFLSLFGSHLLKFSRAENPGTKETLLPGSVSSARVWLSNTKTNKYSHIVFTTFSINQQNIWSVSELQQHFPCKIRSVLSLHLLMQLQKCFQGRKVKLIMLPTSVSQYTCLCGLCSSFKSSLLFLQFYKYTYRSEKEDFLFSHFS